MTFTHGKGERSRRREEEEERKRVFKTPTPETEKKRQVCVEGEFEQSLEKELCCRLSFPPFLPLATCGNGGRGEFSIDVRERRLNIDN